MLLNLLLVLALALQQPHGLLARTDPPADGALHSLQQQHHKQHDPKQQLPALDHRVFFAVNAASDGASQSDAGVQAKIAGQQADAAADGAVVDREAEAATHAALKEVLVDLGAASADGSHPEQQQQEPTQEKQQQPGHRKQKQTQKQTEQAQQQQERQPVAENRQEQRQEQSTEQQQLPTEQQQLPRSRLLQNLRPGEQQQQQQQSTKAAIATATATATAGAPPPQLTILLLSTFKDMARALASISSVRLHLAPQLIREGILLTPWQEYLALRHAVTPTMGGRPCNLACYAPGAPADTAAGGSKVARALQAAGLLSAAPGGGSNSGSEDCDGCGPPLWLVPEHLALGVERKQLADIQIHGYRLQMVLKLMASALISTSHYLVLDSDVLMVRHVGPATAHWLFPEPGKSLYQPQRRFAHARWWDATEEVLGLRGCLSTHPDTRVFGVTPAILSTELAAAAAAFWDARLGSGSRLRTLRAMLPRRRPFFTEYCSYHLVAECHLGNGTIQAHHAVQVKGGDGGGKGKGKEAPALYRGLWRNGTWSRPGGRATPCKHCVFLVVQSNTGIAESKVVGDLEELFV